MVGLHFSPRRRPFVRTRTLADVGKAGDEAFERGQTEMGVAGSADGEKGSSSKDENGSPNRNNNNSYKDKGGGGDDEDDDDIPNVESLHPSSGKNNKADNFQTTKRRNFIKRYIQATDAV